MSSKSKYKCFILAKQLPITLNTIRKYTLSLTLMTLGTANTVWAETLRELPSIQVNIKQQHTQTITVDSQTLKQTASNLGDILSTQTGIHANQFGGGASAPVIHGQDSHRIKILQNGADVVDMSHTSPDHAVVVDATLAKQVDIVDGVDVLRYGSGITGAVVNVRDDKILTQMLSKGFEGEAGFRFNTGNDEKLTHAGASVALGSNVALRVQGLHRKANNYRVANYTEHHEHADDHADGEHDHSYKAVPNTMAKSTSGSVGLSWIGDKGFVGVAYTQREDKYGLPGHSHEYHDCSPLLGDNDPRKANYPEARADKFVVDGEGHCIPYDEEEDAGTGHDDEEHEHNDPIVDLKSKRYDLQAEYQQPFAGVEKVRFTADYTDYKHDEVEDEPVSFFKNKGYNTRLEFEHQPVGKLTGHVGVQFGKNTMSITGEESLLKEASTKRLALFAVERLKFKNLDWSLAGRVERHEIDTTDTTMQDYKKTAYSYGTALDWQMTPTLAWNISASHQQRIPTALEMYAKGAHLASSTWEYGNDQYQQALNSKVNQRLNPEKSNNVSIGFHYKNDVSDYKVTGFYKNYDGYLYAQTLDKIDNLRLIRYAQADAKFYGVNFDMSSQLTPRYNLGVFGDFVRGKIEGQNAPRMPAHRVGYRLKADLGTGWTGSVEALRVFDQVHYADFESKTIGHNIMNVGLNYQRQLANQVEYDVFFKGNNLFDRPMYSHSSFLANIPQMGRNFNIGVNFKF